MSDDGLVEFVEARIVDDEQALAEYDDDGTPGTWSHWGLRDCRAHRQLLEQYERARARRAAGDPVSDDAWQALRNVIQAVAAVYDDHADFRPEWAQ